MPRIISIYPEMAILPLFLFSLLFIQGCRGESENSSCSGCHDKIEQVSASHGGCVSCHGGNPGTKQMQESHKGIFGISDPEDIQRWEKGCAPCHRHQFERMKSNLMYSAAGIIRNTQLTWEGEDRHIYTTRGEAGFAPDGKPLSPLPVDSLDNISGELYRKFCSRCHIGGESTGVYSASHASGCAACHFPWNDEGTYLGDDKKLLGKAGHSASHRMAPLPGNNVCARCHSRSGRIAFSYQGLYDGNNSLVPTANGEPGPVMASGARNLVHITPDVHFSAGMECIDCHTSRDVMGDGYLYANMYLQNETACEDCHGGPATPPKYREISRENDDALRESKNYPSPVISGMRMILTSKGRAYSNVFYQNGKIWVQSKRTGRMHQSRVITGTPEHTVAGHKRLECFSCHSRAVPQCYGCHTTYDKRETGYDFIKKEETPGAFSETEDYRTPYPFPLALDQRGRISPVTPGCQTFVTVIEPDGSRSRTEQVAKFRGKRQLRFAPFYSHNTGRRAIGCSECHANPFFLGFGQHMIEGNNIRGTLLCERSDDKPLDGFMTMQNGRTTPFSAITRENSRPLDNREIRRVMAVNLCLPCHSRADDPIYRKGIDFRAIDNPLHRRLLYGR